MRFLKRTIALSLVFTMILGLIGAMPAKVMAATKYDIWVKDIQVTSDNAGDVLEDGGTVSFDAENKTLTLNSANIVVEKELEKANGISTASSGYTFNLIGENTITIESEYAKGIFFDTEGGTGENLIKGEGSLKIVIKDRSEMGSSIGIENLSEMLKIDGATINIQNGNSNADVFGIVVAGELEIKNADIDIINGNSGGQSEKSNIGINAQKISVENSSVKVVTGLSSGGLVGNYGIHFITSTHFKNSDITLDVKGCGLYGESLIIDGGSLNSKGIKDNIGFGLMLGNKLNMINNPTIDLSGNKFAAIMNSPNFTYSDLNTAKIQVSETLEGELTDFNSDDLNELVKDDNPYKRISITKTGGEDPITYTVSFDANGGTGAMASVQVDKDSNYNLPANEFTPPADKEFKAWDINGTEKNPGESITVSEDTEVKALWRDKGSVEKVTVSFNANGGTGTMTSVQVDKDSNYNLPANEFTPPANKVFKAWSVGGSEKQPGESITVSEDTVAKAIWKNKSQGKPIVDKTDLQDAIDDAQAEIDNTKVSTDGKDVPKSDDWVNKEDKDELQKAIDKAKTIMDKAKATQREIDQEVENLLNAIRTFKAKKAKGQLSERYPYYSLDPSFILWGYYTPSKPTMRPVEMPKSDEKINLQARLVIGSKILEKTVNGTKSNIEMDIAPYIIDGRTMVPIRFVAEALGFKVDWDGDTWTVILKDKYTTIEIPVNTNKIIVNGNVYESDVSPILENGRTFLPIGNVARALGLKDGTDVIWNENTKEVIIKREIIVNL